MGSIKAQSMIGIMYLLGKGIQQDYQQARNGWKRRQQVMFWRRPILVITMVQVSMVKKTRAKRVNIMKWQLHKTARIPCITLPLFTSMAMA